jgi:hypothetical protein
MYMMVFDYLQSNFKHEKSVTPWTWMIMHMVCHNVHDKVHGMVQSMVWMAKVTTIIKLDVEVVMKMVIV